MLTLSMRNPPAIRSGAGAIDPLQKVATDVRLAELISLNAALWETPGGLRVFEAVAIGSIFNFGNNAPRVRTQNGTFFVPLYETTESLQSMCKRLGYCQVFFAMPVTVEGQQGILW